MILYDVYVLGMCMMCQGQSADLWRKARLNPNEGTHAANGWLAHDT